jgi:hypothetical protein
MPALPYVIGVGRDAPNSPPATVARATAVIRRAPARSSGSKSAVGQGGHSRDL